jgi:hypothetical protein
MVSPAVVLARAGEDSELTAGTAGLMIEAASAWLGRQVGWYFGPPEGVTDYLVGRGTRRLWLSGVPLVGEVGGEEPFVTVTESYGSGHEDDAEEIESFTVRGRQLLRHYPKIWWASREYAVTYTHGWVIDEGPADVREAVVQLALWLWGQAEEGGLESEKIGDYSYKLATGQVVEALPFVRTVLAAWRKYPT